MRGPAGSRVALRLLPVGSRRTLAKAIVAVAGGAGGGVPAGALAVGGSGVTGSAVGVRVVRLLDPPAPLPPAARRSALASAALLLLVPTLLLVLPAL